jgi:hypothetical protein
MVCTTMIVNAVSRKSKPRSRENSTETTSSSARTGKRTFNRNARPTAAPTMASAMAAYTIPMSPSFAAVNVSLRRNYSKHCQTSTIGDRQRLIFLLRVNASPKRAPPFWHALQKANHTLIQSQRFTKSSHNLDGISVWPRGSSMALRFCCNHQVPSSLATR